MRSLALRQLLRRMQRRCGDFGTLSCQIEPDAARSGNGSLFTARFKTLKRLNDDHLRDCARALAILDLGSREPTTSECVRQQLVEAVPVHIRELSTAHPWGSTSVVEHLVEPELQCETVTIAVETDELPLAIDADWTRDDVSLPFAFQLRCVKNSPSGGKLAVYNVSLETSWSA